MSIFFKTSFFTHLLFSSLFRNARSFTSVRLTCFVNSQLSFFVYTRMLAGCAGLPSKWVLETSTEAITLWFKLSAWRQNATLRSQRQRHAPFCTVGRVSPSVAFGRSHDTGRSFLSITLRRLLFCLAHGFFGSESREKEKKM